MSDRGGALEQLERILFLLPAAEREDGAEIAELCRALGVSAGELLKDVDQIGSRLYYFPAAWAEDISIDVDSERIRVRSGGKFSRPRRLSPREALALAIALRRLAVESEGSQRDRMLELAADLDGRLGTIPAIDLAPSWSVTESDGSGDGVRAVLREAVRDCRVCELSYMSSAASAVTTRRLRPYLMAERAGTWYVIGYCITRSAVRSFRLDRIIDLTVTEEGFDIPGDFDPADHLEGGRVYTPADGVTVTVRYAATVARWLREQGDVTDQEDGSVLVTYNVSDPSWIIRQVLRYGPEAELLAPDDVRDLLKEALTRVAHAHEAEA